MTLTAVPGVRVGHWTDAAGVTGVTVVDLPEPNITTAEFRGAAPGSRETALLAPGCRSRSVQALLLCGGSAFGLAAADGVVAALRAEGQGHRTAFSVVPIVPAAVIFDLGIGDSGSVPIPPPVPPPTAPPAQVPSRWVRWAPAPAPSSPGGAGGTPGARVGSVRTA
jgi:L-aminopeptidase/D-esterase-like protein